MGSAFLMAASARCSSVGIRETSCIGKAATMSFRSREIRVSQSRK